MIPGEVITADGDIILNKDRPQLEINVSNSSKFDKLRVKNSMFQTHCIYKFVIKTENE